MRHAFDDELGGFYSSGPVDERADDLNKTWWVQAEALVSALTMFRLTRKLKFWECFLKTLSWIENYQADWEGGEWHHFISPDGNPHGPKKEPWKGAYHTGGAMMKCIEGLSLIVSHTGGSLPSEIDPYNSQNTAGRSLGPGCQASSDIDGSEESSGKSGLGSQIGRIR